MSRLKLQQDKAKSLDYLQKSDLDIFKLGATNANYITDYYMRSPQSGTFWKHVPDTPDPYREAAWLQMWAMWKYDGKPQDKWPYKGITYKLLFDQNDDPIFWHHHGWLWQPWQLQMHHAPQPDVTIVGGFGCGKTAAIAMSLAVCAMTIPNFRGIAVAPQMIQAKQVYDYILQTCYDTPFWDRFVWGSPLQPHPQIVVRNSYVGKSVIDILAIEHDVEKIRTLEADYIVLDQAEKLDDLDNMTVNLGSRLRGTVKGRARLGKLVYVANSGDNPSLWQRYDHGSPPTKMYLSLNPKSWDNPYLSKADIEIMKRRVGGSQQDVDQYMGGEKPLGRGEHFPPDIVQACTKEDLNKLVEYNVERNTPGWVLKRSDTTSGVYHLEIPPDHEGGRQYIVVADPGQSNPPLRNSGIIMAWDITNFPKEAAELRAFNWVYGNGEYGPFLTEYERMVKLYRSQSKNAFDSTGVQTGFDELYFATHHLYATGLNMAGTGKYHSLNAAKFFTSKKLMTFPYIPLLSSQLTNYRLPDTNIRQDLVMAFAMSALFMQRYFFIDIPSDDDEDITQDEPHTKIRHSRYRRGSGDRHARPR